MGVQPQTLGLKVEVLRERLMEAGISF